MSSHATGERFYFEDYRLGETFESNARTITEAEVVQYSMFSGDWDRVTTDDGHWAVPEMLSFSVGLCLLLGIGRNVWIPGTFVAFYGYDEIRFDRQLLVGDTIASRVTVDDLVPKGERGIVVYSHETHDQHKRLVCSSRHRVLLARRPGATGEPA